MKKPPGEEINVWVFFTDKGIFDHQTYHQALAEQENRLTPRSRARRLKAKDRQTLLDFTDLPLFQGHVRGVLETGVRPRATSRWLNALSVQANPGQLQRLAELSFVSSLRPVAGGRRREPEVQESAPSGPSMERRFVPDFGPSFTQLDLIAVPQFHRWLEENGHGPPGEGVLICLLDSGFDLAHESLRHVEVLAQWDFINDDGQVADEAGDPVGQDSHGTSVLSIVGGYRPGRLIGPAYGASYALAKTEDISDEQPIEEDYWVEGIEWADSLGAQVASSSLGYLDWYTYADMDGNTAVTTLAADLAVSKGIMVVTAAGNEGDDPWLYIIAPADGQRVVAVGAVDNTGIRAGFSSLGPTYDGRIKPDVMACGRNAYVADPEDTSGYYRGFGTSLSTPQVAGVAALLLQVDSTLTPAEIGDALRSTADRALLPNNYYGWGVINADAARRGEGPQPIPSAALFNYPNPFSESTTIVFDAPYRSSVKVSIFTLAGELVWEHELFWDLGGRCQVDWDGRNVAGEEVASGVYLCQVISRGDVIRGKMVCLRGL